MPESWLGEDAEIDVAVPSRLVCARCDGGGCDGCARSGALRAPDAAEARKVRLRLPAALGAAVRLVQPFGEAFPIEQLIVELRAAETPSAGVQQVAPSRALATVPRPRWTPAAAAAVAVGLGTAIAAALLGRAC